MQFELVFYETGDGQKPVEDFLLGFDMKMRAKMIHMMEILEDKGFELREPYTKPLGDGIFELRCKQANNITRALFFFYIGGILVGKLLLPMVLLKRHLKLRARKFV